MTTVSVDNKEHNNYYYNIETIKYKSQKIILKSYDSLNSSMTIQTIVRQFWDIEST